MKMFNLFGKSVVSVAVLATFCGANAAPNGRNGGAEAQAGRASAMTMRMPTMPTVGLNTIGNPAVTTMNQPVVNVVPAPGPTPEPGPDPQPDPRPDCPDGGVKNSDYTVTACMNDVLQCINTGALQGGLHDMFNEDVRNSIMGGMKLCQASIDKCITEVRVNCRNVYNESNDVWLDFNSRIIQPEYYNFVLRKTGLTPNQAENTCLLLDRNTYGSSFAAVSDNNAVNTEYNQKVGAYNESLNGTLSKDNPQGVAVNTVGYDGNRGHYARWDATAGECLIRVAAYNKDKLITNTWLFGAVGNDKPAEVWQKAGATFTCNKELFDFSSLLNDTKTAAVIGVGGGAVLGGAIGAAAGAGVYNKKHNEYLESVDKKNDPCTDEEYLKQLGAKIYASNKGSVLKSYAFKNVHFDSATGKFTGIPIFRNGDSFNELSESQCRDLHELIEKTYLYESKINECLSNPKNTQIANAISTRVAPNSNEAVSRHIQLQTATGTLEISQNVTCGAPAGIDEHDVQVFDNQCKFVPLRDGKAGVLCEHDNECLTVDQVKYQVDELRSLLNSLGPDLVEPKDANKGKEIGKGLAIGVATGAAAGGVATAITAFVEKSNITCKIGDGLDTVALGKAHTIGSLKDFYVKWNLHLPDTVSPTSAVVDKLSWQQACSQFNNKMSDCARVQINLKDQSGKYTLVPSACKVSGSICVANDSVMASHGIQ